jgi:DNA-directed RNA polymerase I and III subunit RPAC1
MPAGVITIGKDRAEGTDTISSPITHAASVGIKPPSDAAPVISTLEYYPAYDPEDGKGSTLNPSCRLDKMTFRIDNVSAPLANTLRRAILAEVPTMAFDRILIEENDGPVLDEILCHRIGLIPLVAPVHRFAYVTPADHINQEATATAGSAAVGLPGAMPLPTTEGARSTAAVSTTLSLSQMADPTKVICFELDVVGERNQAITVVRSGDLKFVPLPGDSTPGSDFQLAIHARQQEAGAEDHEDAIRIVHDDVPLAKLGPGQRIKIRAFAIKGVGYAHTKWAPASACFYKFDTHVAVDEVSMAQAAPAMEELVDKLVAVCPMGVFEKSTSKKGNKVVIDATRCTLCRECLYNDELSPFVAITKSTTSVVFTVESMGQFSVKQLVPLALKVFASRCRQLAENVETTAPNVRSGLLGSQ